MINVGKNQKATLCTPFREVTKQALESEAKLISILPSSGYFVTAAGLDFQQRWRSGDVKAKGDSDGVMVREQEERSTKPLKDVIV